MKLIRTIICVLLACFILLTVLTGCSINQRKSEFIYPKLFITYGDKQIEGLLGFANYTGKVNGSVGNSNFGASEKKVQELVALQAKPNSIIKINAEEVIGLNKATYTVSLYDGDKEIPITIHKDEIMVPVEEGEYLYDVFVDWGKGDNNVSYWVKIQVQK